MRHSDAEILQAFREDMEKGGKLLFQRYYKPLVLFSGSILEDNNFPEDVVQDVFYQFFKDNSFLRVTENTLATYLFRCVKNACLNQKRDRKKFSQAEILCYDAAEEEAISISPELMDEIHRAIDDLPEKTRRIVTSIVMEGKKYKETAEALGVSINTVKTLLANGLKALRNRFPNSLLLLLLVESKGIPYPFPVYER